MLEKCLNGQCTVGKYGGLVYIMITNKASFAPYKLNIVLLIVAQGFQLRIWFKRHEKASKMPEKIRPALQFYVESELRSLILPGFPECNAMFRVAFATEKAQSLFYNPNLKPPKST